MIILSHFQIEPIVYARRKTHAERAELSIDLNFSGVQTPVTLDDEAIHFPTGEMLAWEDAREIVKTDNACFALETDDETGKATPRKIGMFSRDTRRHVSLFPTASAPTMLLAGFPMHRIKNTDPHQDTLTKVKAASPMGMMLDTSMGLGYTAIEAAKTAQHVVTIELDPAVAEIAAQNPWSAELFTHPRIERLIGDSFDLIETFEDGRFTRVLHDPPTVQLAGDLYSGAYYRELFRILARSGRLFHYIGDLESTSGNRTVAGVIKRLTEAGFTRVTKRPEAFGVIASKS